MEIVMPKQKDPSSRRKTHSTDYAALAGMSDVAVSKQTGSDWAEWVNVLDGVNAAGKPHREIAGYVASLGTSGWWTWTTARSCSSTFCRKARRAR